MFLHEHLKWTETVNISKQWLMIGTKSRCTRGNLHTLVFNSFPFFHWACMEKRKLRVLRRVFCYFVTLSLSWSSSSVPRRCWSTPWPHYCPSGLLSSVTKRIYPNTFCTPQQKDLTCSWVFSIYKQLWSSLFRSDHLGHLVPLLPQFCGHKTRIVSVEVFLHSNQIQDMTRNKMNHLHRTTVLTLVLS